MPQTESLPPAPATPRPSRHWRHTKDGDPRALTLYERHYSCRRYADGRTRKLFCGPGQKTVLLTPRADALFVWRKFIDHSGQTGINAACFRNEGRVLSSRLIREAMQIAWQRWPGERLYTYVNAGKVASSNPGYCFLQAGWQKCGRTKRHRLLILAIEPDPGCHA